MDEKKVIKEEICIEISRDKMLGVLSFIPPQNGGRLVTLEEVRVAMKDKGVVKGILEEDLKEIVKNHEPNHKYIIARGQAPVDGKDGSIELAFDVDKFKQVKPKMNEDGTVDLKDLGTVKNIKAGDRLATKIVATPGQDGFNVQGQVLRAQKGREARIPKGRNTKILEDGLTLVAEIDGKLEYDDHNVYINSVYTVFGDLDSSIGNIDFVGSVVVHGSLQSGLTIKAGGSVEVRGPVDNAVIIAGTDIILGYGIQGTEKSKLVAKGNVIAKFIQNAYVEAGGSVITEAILHSTVTAGDSIQVELGKGTIVGGSVAATNLILARSIGSPMGTVTALQIGVNPSVYVEYKALAEKVKEEKQNLSKIDQSIRFLISKGKKEPLTTRQKNMLQRFDVTRQSVAEAYEEVRSRHQKLGEVLGSAQEGMVKCSGNIYPGVKITFGHLIKYIDEYYTGVSIRKLDGDIHISV